MHELSCQLVSKWARHGPKNKIAVTDNFTRFTLGSIALYCMDTRFNSFYRGVHPFVSSMTQFLAESGARAQRPGFVTNYVHRASTQKYWENVKVMRDVADSVVSERRENPSSKKDLLDTMINGKDPKTGEQMSDPLLLVSISAHFQGSLHLPFKDTRPLPDSCRSHSMSLLAIRRS
jgi:cytochrome P450 / NADPH-cytochrome P450 reductase